MKTLETYPNYAGIQTPVPIVKGKVVDERTDLAIRLIQQSKNRYAVVYGLEARTGMDYTTAATRYGFCCFHALECAGKLNANRH